MWTFPAPPEKSEWKALPFESQYTELLQAISESNDDYERRLAELAFAIFLLGHNYHLSPSDYEQLLQPGAAAPASSDWQRAVEQFAQEHLRSFVDASALPSADRRARRASGVLSRLTSWLRDLLPRRWFSVESRSL
jgi:hypothetical protein